MMQRLARVLGLIREAILGLALAAAAWLLSRTLRVRHVSSNAEPDGPLIYAFLHGQQLPLLRFPLPRRTAAIVSRSRDGSLQARVLGGLGFRILRGSSSSGGAAALRSSMDWLRRGGDLALAVDGPRGPRGAAKPGVVFLAEKAHAPIIPVACSAHRARRLARSWDGFLVPAPFTTTVILSGAPFRPWEKDWTQDQKLAYLDSQIAALSNRADQEAFPSQAP
jgi:lysophospholipid acyltransferase (LPLAT)-like uncharacterized protein